MAEPANLEYLGPGRHGQQHRCALGPARPDREALAQYQRGVEFAERAFTAARYSVLYGRFLATGRRNESRFLAQLGLADDAIAPVGGR